MPIECSTKYRMRSGLAVIPVTHRSRSTVHALRSISIPRNKRYAMIGSNALSWSWPASAAIVTVTSPPITSKQTWFTTSGMTGLTLPGMIDEPGCIAGRLISPNPARGPDERRRRSLQILDSLVAVRFMTPESCTKAPVSLVASTRSNAVITGTSAITARCLHANAA